MPHQSQVERGERRFNRAVIAAGAAITVAVVGAAYAVYRAQAVFEGMKQQFETTTALYHNPEDAALTTEKKSSAAP